MGAWISALLGALPALLSPSTDSPVWALAALLVSSLLIWGSPAGAGRRLAARAAKFGEKLQASLYAVGDGGPRPSHLDLFTGREALRDEAASFSRFPSLPSEIRLLVWEQFLSRPRIVRARLKYDGDWQRGASGSPAAEEEGNRTSTAPYYLRLNRRYPPSVLMRVSSEAREAALRFYRLPLRRGLVPGRAGPPVMINPEHDFLHISFNLGDDGDRVEQSAVQYLPNLLLDLKAWDPQRVGLLNLAVDERALEEMQRLHDDDLGEPPEGPARDALVSTLSQLREVFWVCLSSSQGARAVMGAFSGIPGEDKWRFNRSYPIKPTWAVGGFERLRADPRQIGEDLRRVYAGQRDARGAARRWAEIMDKWGAEPAEKRKETECRYLLASVRPFYEESIKGRETARQWLEWEDEHWNTGLAQLSDGDFSHDASGTAVPVDKTEPPQQTPQSAVGFWLLSEDALGPIPQGGEQGGERLVSRRMVDLREHWPALCVADLG